MALSAWRKGDLVRYKEKEFRLTSEPYEIKPGRMGFDTDRDNGKKYPI